ncbi:peptidoglycan DD-metalloendopeptidase family protein [Neisseriaceae bacterium TC5R-5]|nr:peptidoglycan DD-metalloendopeptidase family protein [Neisseriaceae bacterium TC5R-5]
MAQKSAPIENAGGSPTQNTPTTSSTGQAKSGAITTPYKDESLPATSKSKTHVAQAGENLFRIALNNGLKYQDLISWNQLPDHNIKVGQVLRLTPPNNGKQPSANKTQPIAGSVDNNIKTYPKALKLPYSTETANTLIAQSEGTATKNNNTQASNKNSDTNTVNKPKQQTTNSEEDAVPWIWPTDGKILKTYSESSKGVDISGRSGQAILAAGEGKVVYSGTGLRGYGKLIIIKHNKTFLSAYAHNSQLLVKEGQSVRKGQKIAEMGNTDAEQVKLHFEIRRFGKPVDPMQYLDHKS